MHISTLGPDHCLQVCVHQAWLLGPSAPCSMPWTDVVWSQMNQCSCKVVRGASVAGLGPTSLAAHTVVKQIADFCMGVLGSFSVAAQSLVANALGQVSLSAASHACWPGGHSQAVCLCQCCFGSGAKSRTTVLISGSMVFTEVNMMYMSAVSKCMDGRCWNDALLLSPFLLEGLHLDSYLTSV